MRIARYVLAGTTVLLSGTGCATLLPYFATVIPPRSETLNNIHGIERRIHLYWDEHGRLPASPSELPIEPNKVSDTTDGWGRELRWTFVDEMTIRVSSLGRDGEVGGAGEDEDWNVDVVVPERRHASTRSMHSAE